MHVITDYASAGDADVRIRLLDQDLNTIQAYKPECSAIPSVVTHASLSGQILISSPEFPPVWCIIGAGLTKALKKDSANPAFTAIDPPPGICAPWAGRIVLAEDDALRYSDPGEPRTYAALNYDFGIWSSRIYGISASSQGALCVGTRDGIFVAPDDAATNPLVAAPWTRVSDTGVMSYDSMAYAMGKVFALTRRGIRQVFPAGPEYGVNDSYTDRYLLKRADHEDYRDGRLYGGEDGVYLSIGDMVYVLDLSDESPFGSWWSAPNESSFRLRGIMNEDSGADMLVTEDAVMRVYGNFDGDEALSEGGSTVHGGYSGTIKSTPRESLKMVETHWGSDTGGYMRVVSTGTNKASLIDQVSPVIGADSWSSTDPVRNAPLQSKVQKWDVARTDEIHLELSVENPGSRVTDELDVILKGPGLLREDE